MRKMLLGTAVVIAMASPATAKDHSGYVGIDVGAVWPKSQDIFGNVAFSGPVVCNALPPATCTLPTDFANSNIGSIKYKTGIDADLIGGYDFGMFRIEGEVGYKHGKVSNSHVNQPFLDSLNLAAGTLLANSDFNLDKTTNVWDAMLNGWLDFGGETGIGGGVGAGVGYAGVHQFGQSKGKLAWQLLAQVYYPVSPKLRYRPEVPLLPCRIEFGNGDVRLYRTGGLQRASASGLHGRSGDV